MEQALDLMRRLPPAKVTENLTGLVDLAPHLTEELLARVDQPLQVAFDSIARKDFLLCDYNRDGDSYRSPWSNTYFPPLEDGMQPSPATRQLEAEANDTFCAYREQYFGVGTSSAYLWDLENGFAGCFLIKKDAQHAKKATLSSGVWDSIHVVEVVPDARGAAAYKLTSTVMLQLNTKVGAQLSGSLTRQAAERLPVDAGHMVNIGSMIEDMEGRLRNSLDQVYFQKTREVLSAVRLPVDDTLRADSKQAINMQAHVISEMLRKQNKANVAIKPSDLGC